MHIGVKVRGIYTTALTRVLLDSGFAIAQPAPEIQARFGLKGNRERPHLLIRDREDLQGVTIVGGAERINQLLPLLQDRLLDAVLLEFVPLPPGDEGAADENFRAEDLARARFEFGGAAKESLDKIRSLVVPSLDLHHRLRIIHPQKLARNEKDLDKEPGTIKERSRKVFRETVILPLRKAGEARIERVKIAAKPLRPPTGDLLKCDGRKIVIKRLFSGGRYDGLDLPIEEGDYGLTETQEGAWQVKHSYFSRTGRAKGVYYDISTPVEFYPTGIRYIGLEVDIVQRAGEPPRLREREGPALLADCGCIGQDLAQKAVAVAEALQSKME
jgi:hypothetical protein